MPCIESFLPPAAGAIIGGIIAHIFHVKRTKGDWHPKISVSPIKNDGVLEDIKNGDSCSYVKLYIRIVNESGYDIANINIGLVKRAFIFQKKLQEESHFAQEISSTTKADITNPYFSNCKIFQSELGDVRARETKAIERFLVIPKTTLDKVIKKELLFTFERGDGEKGEKTILIRRG